MGPVTKHQATAYRPNRQIKGDCCPTGLTMRLRRRLLQLLALLAMGLGLYVLWYTGLVLRLQHHNPTQSAYMERAEAQGQVQQAWRDYDQISDHLKRAVLISEDARFTEHTGFDWDGIRYAIKRNMEAGKPVAGGPPLPSSSPRTCISPASAPICARPRKP